MKAHHALAVLAVATLLVAPGPAAAFHDDDHSCGSDPLVTDGPCQPNSADCVLLGQSTCHIEIEQHRIFWRLALDCVGQPGNFVGCNIHHECFYRWSGVLVAVTMTCGKEGEDVTGGTGAQTHRGAGGVRFVLSGPNADPNCDDFTMRIVATSAVVIAAEVAHNYHLCVDRTGPFLDPEPGG